MHELDDVMQLGRGSTWSPVPCRDWSPPGGESRGFRPGPVRLPTPDEWARLAGALSCCCPGAVVAIGPVITGGGPIPRRGERLPGLVLVALADNPDPLETAFHEAAHEVWDRLVWDEFNAIEAYAVAAGEAAWGQGIDHEPFMGDEGGPYVFGRWAAGQPDIARMPPACLAAMQAIKCGEVGSRKR